MVVLGVTIYINKHHQKSDIPVGTIKLSKSCRLWEDDFNAICKSDWGKGWSIDKKVGGGCPYGLGKAECKKYYNIK